MLQKKEEVITEAENGDAAVQEEKAGIALGKRVDGQAGAFSDGETTGARGGLMDSACLLRFSGSHG